MEFKYLLLPCLLMVAGFSVSYNLNLDGSAVGDQIDLAPGTHVVELESWSTNLTVLNYSFHVTPRNLEHLAERLGIPLQNQVNQPIADHFESGEQSFDVPDAICGNFHARGTIYFEEEDDLGKIDLEKQINIPCASRRARFLYVLFSALPWPMVNALLNAFGAL